MITKQWMISILLAILSMNYTVALAQNKPSTDAKPSKQEAAAKTNGSIYTDPNKVIQVSNQSPIITLKLKSTPSTGYSWYLLNYNDTVFTPLGVKYQAADTKAVGAAGVEEWRFRVNAKAFNVPQIQHITLSYIRLWVVTGNGRKMEFTIAIKTRSQRARTTKK